MPRTPIAARLSSARLLSAGWVLFLLAAPAAADWLVTRDGARVETRGPWEVKGRQVVFTLASNGSLSALRLSEVDLEASEAATAESQRPPEPPPPEAPPKKPVLVITNNDLPQAARDTDDEPLDDVGEDEAADEDTSTVVTGDAQLELANWQSNPSQEVDGLEISGAIRNGGSDLATNLTVNIKIPDEDGTVFFETNAFVRSTGLAAGRTTTFRALLPGIFQLPADPVFELGATAVSILGRGEPGRSQPAARQDQGP